MVQKTAMRTRLIRSFSGYHLHLLTQALKICPLFHSSRLPCYISPFQQITLPSSPSLVDCLAILLLSSRLPCYPLLFQQITLLPSPFYQIALLSSLFLLQHITLLSSPSQHIALLSSPFLTDYHAILSHFIRLPCYVCLVNQHFPSKVNFSFCPQMFLISLLFLTFLVINHISSSQLPPYPPVSYFQAYFRSSQEILLLTDNFHHQKRQAKIWGDCFIKLHREENRMTFGHLYDH